MQSLNKFFTETSLHGFCYADDKNKFFAVFWVLVSVVCAGLATNDIIGLVQTYQSVPIQVALTAELNNNLTLPTPTLCMEILVVPPGITPSIAELTTDIQTFMTTTGNGTNHQLYSSSQMGLTASLEYLTYIMLGYITNAEMFYIKPTDQSYTEYATKYTAITPTVWLLTETAYNTYMTYSASLSDLKALVGASICRKQYVESQGGVDTQPLGPLQICQPDTMTHLSFSHVCSKVFKGDTFQVAIASAISVDNTSSGSDPNSGLKPAVMLPSTCRDPRWITEYDTNDFARYLWHLDLQGRSVFPSNSLLDVITIDPQIPSQKFYVFVSTEYNYYNTPSRPCVTDTFQYRCQWKTLVERMSQTCGCWPSSIIDLANTYQLPTCSNDLSINPYPNGVNLNNSDRCDYELVTWIDESECPRQCQSYLYSLASIDSFKYIKLSTMAFWHFDTFARKQRLEPTGGSFQVLYQTQSFRTVITEELTMSFTPFACAFGGSIGTWLGGSILAFVHIPIFIIAQLYDHYSKRNKVDNSNKVGGNVKIIPKADIYPPASDESINL